MNIELKHLQLVYNTSTLGSLSKCAEAMHITQPAASHLLKNLEEQLGAAVFYRVNKKMVITKVGDILLHAAREVLPKMEQYKVLVANEIDGKKGSIKIATECHTSYNWLPNVLHSFQKSYPNIEVGIDVEATGKPLNHLLDGKIDLAIMINPVHEHNLSYFELFEDEVLLVVPKGHELESKKYVTALDFAEVNYIMYTEAFENNSVANTVLIPENVQPRKITKLQLTEAIIEMVNAGIGVTTMSNWLLKPFLQSRSLNSIRITKKGIFRKWSIVSHKGMDTQDYLTDFIGYMQKEIDSVGAFFR